MQDYSESDEMYSQVRALYARFGATFGANVAKPQQAKQKIGAAVEKVVKVPELPKGIVITQPVPDAAKRLNPKPKSWDLPLELLQKPKAKYTMGTIIRVSELLANHQDYIGQIVTVAGWVRSTRSGDNEKLAFVQLSDGTCFDNLQLVVEKSIPNFDAVLATNTGYSIKATGLVIKSPAAGQLIEINVSAANHEVIVLGSANAKEYPIPKGKQNPETLRQVAHLRPRTNFIGAIARIRNNLAYATHVFFQTHGCLYVHTPIITSNDCEGAGEMFQVTTILKDKIKDIPQKDGAVDFTKDFFQKPTNLTVSGQLNVENFCCALSNVYTFGPTFRAEISRTYRHLAEFWMIEPEFAFADLFDNMDAAEAYVKFCINFALTNNLDDLKFLDERVKPGLIDYLRDIASQSFVRCSYTQGVEILMEAIKKGAKFEKPVSWGIDLGSEHERFLAEKVFKRPVCLYDYPKDIKAFYMKVTDDGKCVRAMDMLIPQVGELIGGSQREERYDVLVQRMKECKLNPEDYKAYLDLRKYGTIPHAGFGLGFERLVMMVTGVENIRDVIPFPRWVDNAEF